MLNNPTPYNVGNYLTMGGLDVLNGAFNPDEPFSFEHFLNSFGFAAMVFGGYKGLQKKTASGKPDFDIQKAYKKNAVKGVALETEDGGTSWYKADGSMNYLCRFKN